MEKAIYLDGKVVKESLPAFQSPDPSLPTVKRLLLPQGELAQFYDGDEPIRYLACIELRSGSVRGNHYHRIKHESIYLLGGSAVLLVEDIETQAKAAVPLQAGDLATVSTGVAHAIQTVESGLAIEFSPSRFDPEDTYRFPLTK